MKKHKIVIHTLLLILVFLSGALCATYAPKAVEWYKNQSKKSESEENKETGNNYILSKNVLGYVVSWDQDNGFETIKNNKDKINTISPVWYKIKKDGTIDYQNGAEDRELLDFARKNNIKVMPTLTNECEAFDSEEVLKSDELTNIHLKVLSDLLDKNNYAGLNINYECLSGAPVKGRYESFMKKASDMIHGKGKILGVSLHAKTTDKGTWEGPETQDFRYLSGICDQLQLMMYDNHWATSEAGEIAPIPWIEETIAYALKNIPAEKIYLGIHFYGYDWVGEQAKDLTYSDVLNLVERYKPEVKSTAGKEKYFTYKQGDESHTVYYADQETVKERTALVKKYNLSGISIWRLGQEDPKNWDAIAEIFK